MITNGPSGLTSDFGVGVEAMGAGEMVGVSDASAGVPVLVLGWEQDASHAAMKLAINN
jgi:hypothetical protein